MTIAVPTGQATAPSRTNVVVWWNAFFFMLLCAAETGFMAGALDWGVAGMLHFSPAVYLPLSAVLALGVAWVSVLAFRRALRSERLIAGRG